MTKQTIFLLQVQLKICYKRRIATTCSVQSFVTVTDGSVIFSRHNKQRTTNGTK